jgi:hypothetical protein
VCWCAVVGIGYPINMKHKGPSCDITETLTTLLLLLLEIAGLEGLEMIETT